MPEWWTMFQSSTLFLRVLRGWPAAVGQPGQQPVDPDWDRSGEVGPGQWSVDQSLKESSTTEQQRPKNIFIQINLQRNIKDQNKWKISLLHTKRCWNDGSLVYESIRYHYLDALTLSVVSVVSVVSGHMCRMIRATAANFTGSLSQTLLPFCCSPLLQS